MTTRRLVLPSVPLHLRQRGVDGGPTFIAADDYAYYLWALRHAATAAQCLVHAYALMTNHVHLLVTPEDVTGPARLMKALGRRYVRYFNDRYQRTGPLWEGRYRSTIVDSREYFFSCSRYIDQNPVRAGLVEKSGAYTWSSYRHNALGGADRVVTPHAEYDALGADRTARCAAYRRLCDSALDTIEAVTVRAELPGRPRLYPTAYQQLAASMLGLGTLRRSQPNIEPELPRA